MSLKHNGILLVFSERLNAMLKKLFSAQITGDIHEELVKAAANGKILKNKNKLPFILIHF